MALEALIAALAVWRVSLLITEEEGPFSWAAMLRERIDPHQKTWVGRGLQCVWCVSFWAALAATLWLWWFDRLASELIPVWWFGLSGAAILANQWLAQSLRRR